MVRLPKCHSKEEEQKHRQIASPRSSLPSAHAPTEIGFGSSVSTWPRLYDLTQYHGCASTSEALRDTHERFKIRFSINGAAV